MLIEAWPKNWFLGMWTCLCERVVSKALHGGVNILPVKVTVIPLSCQETHLYSSMHMSQRLCFSCRVQIQ